MASAYQVSFLDAIKIRRSILSLSKESPITDQRIVLLVNHAIKHAPSPFHVQSARAIVLFGDEHEKLWNIGFEVSKKTVPPQVFEEKYAEKINGFKAGYGTVGIFSSQLFQILLMKQKVLFFEDTSASSSMPPPLQDLLAKYPDWYEHSQGMVQFITWTALATEGLGCNLQHFHPSISADVAREWNVPSTWRLTAQLVFGKPTGPPRGGVEKNFESLEGRVRVVGSKSARSPVGI